MAVAWEVKYIGRYELFTTDVGWGGWCWGNKWKILCVLFPSKTIAVLRALSLC